MKKLFCFFAFLFLCFYASCVPHELESPAITDASPPRQKTLPEEVVRALNMLPPCFFYQNSVPINEIWAHANYADYQYEIFLNTSCPQENQKIITEGGQKISSCDYAHEGFYRQLSITDDSGKITISFQKFGYDIPGRTRILRGLWEITKTPDGFSLVKNEIIDNGSFPTYNAVKQIYKDDGQNITLAAEGRSGSLSAYSFSFESIIFTSCKNVPNGRIHISGKNYADVLFDEKALCDNCVPIKISNVYGRFKYCNDWALINAFKYLKSFLSPI